MHEGTLGRPGTRKEPRWPEDSTSLSRLEEMPRTTNNLSCASLAPSALSYSKRFFFSWSNSTFYFYFILYTLFYSILYPLFPLCVYFFPSELKTRAFCATYRYLSNLPSVTPGKSLLHALDAQITVKAEHVL